MLQYLLLCIPSQKKERVEINGRVVFTLTDWKKGMGTGEDDQRVFSLITTMLWAGRV